MAVNSVDRGDANEGIVAKTEESREVNNSFPEALKEPILRRIQFSTVSRVDNLGMPITQPCLETES